MEVETWNQSGEGWIEWISGNCNISCEVISMSWGLDDNGIRTWGDTR